mmetsp:Transcript_5499/g.10084  ORF Transcript_5499/g.10084 Transcript_5499/m.10084 type:complete len:517 (+) Transcript_5499:109-1659(+)|eukprot:CAMPEP_0202504646 /NCGR_PEP_ID=MMETSP1361-20130828/45127_1 /ASSEMBLY_ACC=CAM_ASM_000849 /TAXON_ID=210615 /ORGANISM="Staurosira complex sp., Strain CCMP2646" /LENGTH=516 /DNA_ID=CAMNT_0049138213 /DNA_START=32 /DNA_END=1582 /DNA_ORIENTATION=-
MTMQLAQLIVGAGVNGINTAVVFQENGIPFEVFERSGVIGGVWNRENTTCGSANAGSNVQSDPIMYSPAGWYLEEGNKNAAIDTSDPFRGIHQSVDMVIMNTCEIQEKCNIPIHFYREVISFERHDDGTVAVVWMDQQSKKQHVDKFAGIHFRTGRLNSVSKVVLPNESDFSGSVVDGCYGQAEKLDYKDKTVVIIGWGAFAVENATMALQKGATKVHMVARNKKPHWFDYATFTARKFYFAELDPNWVPTVWEDIFDINERAAKACGVQDVLYSPDVHTKVDGKRHLFLHRGGLPSMSIDPVALGMHYGLIEFHQGSVSGLTTDSVVLSSGTVLKADVVIKSTGFNINLGPIDGHYMIDTIFVDGHANVTSYHAIDGCEEDVFVGPSIPGTSTLLVSAYPLRDFDRAVVYFLITPQKFQEFKGFPTFTKVKKAEAVQFVSVMHTFNKLFAFGDENIVSNFVESMTKKREEYEKMLDEQSFLKYDKMHWDAWSELFATKTGKPFLAYHSIDCMDKV